ncbi:hypothetical protein VNO77_00783 [Canavalia gladiata]|uniref:pectinesterase n=1 Tax=Canavalia gladiata TaxID=3824 RepID=A0AAN9MUU8_CANGL
MASLPCIFLFLFLTLSSAERHQHSPHDPTLIEPEIKQACKATRFPQECESSLFQYKNLPPNPTPLQLLQSTIAVSSSNLATAQSMVKSLLDSSAGNLNLTDAATICIELLNNSQQRISLTNDALPRGWTKDARAWLGAALNLQDSCFGHLKHVNGTQMVDKALSFFDALTTLSNNSLSMAFSYDVFGNDTTSWKLPVTERDGFWEPLGSDGGGSVPRIPSKLKPDVTVCKGGGKDCYKTVQEAVNRAPDNGDGERRFVIYIKEGVYEEIVMIPFEKKNVVFIGDGIGKTVITASRNANQPGVTTFTSATVVVLGDGFMARDLTIQNTAGAGAGQAVAFRLDSDRSVIENCEFLGNQDTLYARSMRQFYKSCRIVGNVDFIFGNAAAIFQDCQILVSPKQVSPDKVEFNAITAHGRTDPAQPTGFVFHNCLINGTEEYMTLYHNDPKMHKNYLGRPWKDFSRTVFIHTFLEALITPQGWNHGIMILLSRSFTMGNLKTPDLVPIYLIGCPGVVRSLLTICQRIQCKILFKEIIGLYHSIVVIRLSQDVSQLESFIVPLYNYQLPYNDNI